MCNFLFYFILFIFFFFFVFFLTNDSKEMSSIIVTKNNKEKIRISSAANLQWENNSNVCASRLSDDNQIRT